MPLHTLQTLLSNKDVYLDNMREADGETIYLDYIGETYDENNVKTIHYFDQNNVEVLQLNPDTELQPKHLSKGVFITENLLTGKQVSIQFFKSTPLDAKNI